MDIFLSPSTIFFSLLGGVLPAIFWLWFWLKEDKLHPEPRGLIILSFIIGMIATIVAYPLEKYVADHVEASGITLLFLWSAIEEILKFAVIVFIIMRSKYFDEPIDAVIYFVTIALGFSAMENTMFLVSPIENGDILGTIMLGNLRFIGATLLHVAASGIIGVALGFTFFYKKIERGIAVAVALYCAIVLHTIFNFTIIKSEGRNLHIIFIGIWMLILGILLFCERIKRMPPEPVKIQ